MLITIQSVEDIGKIAKDVRLSQGLRQDDLGFMSSCSHKFIIDVEKGKATVQTGKLLDLLADLGIKVSLDVPTDIGLKLQKRIEGQPL